MSETGARPASEECIRRGYHGPFANVEKYDAVPGWEGHADCLTCGSTCRTLGVLLPDEAVVAPPLRR